MELTSMISIILFLGIFTNLILISVIDIKYHIIPHTFNISLGVLSLAYNLVNMNLERFISFSIIFVLILAFLGLIIFIERKKEPGTEGFGWGDRFLVIAMALGLSVNSFITFTVVLFALSLVLIFFLLARKNQEVSMGEFIGGAYGLALLNEISFLIFPEQLFYETLIINAIAIAVFVGFVIIGLFIYNGLLKEEKELWLEQNVDIQKDENAIVAGENIENKECYKN